LGIGEILASGRSCRRNSDVERNALERWKLVAVNVLLGVERGEHNGLVVNFGGVLVDGSCGLGAKIAIARVEVKSADVVGAMGAGEPHASLDASDGVKTLHSIKCSLLARERKARGVSGEGNDGEVLMWKRKSTFVATPGGAANRCDDASGPSTVVTLRAGGAKDNPRSG